MILLPVGLVSLENFVKCPLVDIQAVKVVVFRVREKAFWYRSHLEFVVIAITILLQHLVPNLRPQIVGLKLEAAHRNADVFLELLEGCKLRGGLFDSLRL